MKRSHRMAWWSVYAAGSAGVLLALGWVTARVVHLQHEEAGARAQVVRQEQIRQALWRMDSWLSPRLARESARTWFEYESYYPQVMAYNRMLEPLGDGEVVLPSPLLTFNSLYLPLHFQYRNGVGFTSPQVPGAAYVARDTIGCSPVPSDPARSSALLAFSTNTDASDLLSRLATAEAVLSNALNEDPEVPQLTRAPPEQAGRAQQSVAPAQWARMQKEAAYDLKARRETSNTAQQQVMEENSTQMGIMPGTEVAPQQVQVGPLLPVWLGDPPNRLVLVRRVILNSERLVQGVVVNWPALKKELLTRVEDLMPGADIRPAPPGAELDPSVALGSLPVVLVPPASLGAEAEAGKTEGLAGLGLVWLAALGALGTTGFALRSTINSAVQTSRFASSVTHELRTPLTTFRLYAEMLSDGMVTNDEQRKQYLSTLRDESARLGFLVENVLTWSRVEEGRATVETRPISADELVSAAEPLLRSRCAESGATFAESLTADPASTAADADRVRQVLFNLVDNSCKYAGQGATVRLSSQVRDGRLILAVDDDGPGIPAHLRRRIFHAFDRGVRGPGDTIRGLGLGLAISRELTRSLGGELRCTTSDLGGARFELELPTLS